MNLVARLVDKALHTKGHISLNWIGLGDKIKSEITNPNSLLSIESKKLVLKYLAPATDTFTIDTKQQHGALSADDNLKVLSSALWHVVTETIFYDEKLHLTEKIFKPIVAQRPFILVSAPNNLKYLKSYGFQTFSKWIDESYDQELDPDQRIIKIVNETEKLCNLTRQQLEQMHYDMKETLEYNFNWFYTGFKKQIIDELVDNFRRILINQNAGKDKSFESYIDYSQLDFDLIKQKLYQ